MIRQRTLRNPVRASGIGLHSGEPVTLVLRPAPAGSGIVFRRVDLDPVVEIPATADGVGSTRLCTVLRGNGEQVATVEHLMAALAGLGIDNARVDVDGGEVPIMDGSAAPFVFLLRSAGICEQDAAKQFIRVRRPVVVEDGDRHAGFFPCDGFRAEFSIDFEHPVLRATPARIDLDFCPNCFVREVSRARTFGFTRDVAALRARGLARGGSVENTVVVGDSAVLNPGGLRYADEFVRHKLLDAVGDLYLAGHSLIGGFRAHKSGHELNNAALRALLAQTDAWERVTLAAGVRAPFSPLDDAASIAA